MKTTFKSERHYALDAYASACNGNCVQGRFCDCQEAVVPIPSLEQEHPWMYYVYALFFALAALGVVVFR